MSEPDWPARVLGKFIEVTSCLFKPFTDAARDAAIDAKAEKDYNRKHFGAPPNQDNDDPEYPNNDRSL